MEKEIDEKILKVLLASIKGEASDDEYRRVWSWIHESKENEKFYMDLRDSWIASGLNRPVNSEQVLMSWKRVKNRLFLDEQKNKPNSSFSLFFFRFLKNAALFILLIGIGAILSHLYFDKLFPQKVLQKYTVEAPRGSKSVVTLADGTKVWLNAGSSLKYSRDFNQQNRDVFLEGEAYFSVAKNKILPFLVHTSGIVVRAVGTVFDVKAYPDEKVIETTLINGIVSIEHANKAGTIEKITLKPNQKAIYYKDDKFISGLINNPVQSRKEIKGRELQADNQKVNILIADKIDPEISTSWKDKRWVFNDESLGNFAVKVERLYDVNISFKDEQLKHYKLSGSLEEETIEQLFDAIRLTVPMNYTINHKEVILSLNKQLKESYEKLLKR
ncbi:MAG: FecR family protein [Bacteroidota bacterium]|nr:FecR family protein [Bacteroidota bacterium]